MNTNEFEFDRYLQVAKEVLETNGNLSPFAITLDGILDFPSSPVDLKYTDNFEDNCYEWFKIGIRTRFLNCKRVLMVQLVKITNFSTFVEEKDVSNEVDRAILLCCKDFIDDQESSNYIYVLDSNLLYKASNDLVKDMRHMLLAGYNALDKKVHQNTH